jgi:pimeloyl-ACP methyl ester carboxylesterase
VIYGDRDFITGPACADDLVRGIAHAERAVIAGAGHMPFFEKPHDFRVVVSGFLHRALRATEAASALSR